MKTSLRLSGCALCLFLTLTAAAQPSAQPSADTARWTPELSMRYRIVMEVALSPDGRRVAYVVREPLMEGEQSEYRSHIWVAAADGSGEGGYQYTRGEKSAAQPAFSPDGRYLAFTSSRSGTNQVWIMRVEGGEAEQLTEAPSGVASYRWSPDGTRIAYTMQDEQTEEEKQREKEKRDVLIVDQDFKYNHLYTVPVEKNSSGERPARRLTKGAFHVTEFDWSPDGRALAFAHQADPRINTGFLESDLSTVPADSGAVTPLVTWPGADGAPRYAPDGRWVAFVSHGGSSQAVGLRDVFVVPAGGGAPRALGATPDRNATLLAWRGDGRAVFVAEFIGTTRRVLELPLDGGAPRVVTPVEGVVGSPGGGVAFDRAGGRMAFVYQDLTTPEEVYVSPVASYAPQRLSRVNLDVPRPPMGRTEVITWTSPDGLPVEGLLTYPVGYRPGRRYPLILNIHGGPAGVFLQGFTGAPRIYMIQYFADQGYAVLQPNPRGSTGYGKDFRFANVQDWGYGDYEDVMAGVDRVIEMGVGHPDSLAVMGWSYGGYLTSFIVTRTDRFKAASMGAGLPNLVSMVTTTDIPDYLVAHMGGEVWDDFERYERHSALYRIRHVTTPTQVIHGAQDLRVPFSQGQEFYVALKRRGVPTEMVVYPRTPHGPQEPKFLMDVSERILAWFDRHLRDRSAPSPAGTE